MRDPVLLDLKKVKGIFGKKKVPEDFVAFALSVEGSFDITLKEGDTLPQGIYLLIRKSPFPLNLKLEGISLCDGSLVWLEARGSLRFGTGEIEAPLALEGPLAGRSTLTLKDFQKLFSELVRPKAQELLSKLSLGDLLSPSESFLQSLKEALSEEAFSWGIEEAHWSLITFGGEALERARREAELAVVETEKEKLWASKRLALEESEARRKARLEAERLRAELQRLRQIDQVLSEVGLGAQVLALGDEKLKAKVLGLLFEKELRRGKDPGEEERIEKELSKVKEQVRQLLLNRKGVCLALAGGDRLWIWRLEIGSDPASEGNLQLGFGSARTVRPVKSAGGALFAVGTTRGVALVHPITKEVIETYPLPSHAAHGVNGIYVNEKQVWATHWELGLLSWRRGEGKASRLLDWQVRALACDPSGALLCGSEGFIFLIKEDRIERIPFESEVTCMCETPRGTLVGDKAGRVHLFSEGELQASVSIGSKPVTSLSLLEEPSGSCKFAACTRDERVLLYDLELKPCGFFASAESLIWNATCWPFVAGASKSGEVDIWWSYRPEGPSFRLFVPETITGMACCPELEI